MNNMIEELCCAGLSGKFGELVKDKRWVKIWVRDDFRCVYCNTFLLGDIVHMVSAQIDHLLPQWKYGTLAGEESNQVLACFCCNQLKREFDPLDQMCKQEDRTVAPDEALEQYRDTLLNICKEHLAQRLEQKRGILSRSTEVLKRYSHEIP